ESVRSQNEGTRNQEGLADRVLYAPSPEAIPPELWTWLEVHKPRVVLVVDECEPLLAERFAGQARRSERSVRLVTVGVSEDVTSRHPVYVSVLERLDAAAMEEVVLSAARTLPRTQLTEGRGQVIWTLAQLAQYEETFFGAARLLLALAETEGERPREA